MNKGRLKHNPFRRSPTPFRQTEATWSSTTLAMGIKRHTAYGITKKAFSFMNYVPKLYSIVPYWLKSVIDADMPALKLNYDVVPNNVDNEN